ncbi:MAG: twin-arginine translocase subunit TatC [Muribaculaceae bacterium]|nr:twin-arginine translocase subunit TatC [Bacteroidales bacterium]MDY4811686.1 twin-arginine translocase subunit TatC [Muribaculaceae bacterium]
MQNGETTFWDHLDVLRGVLIRMAITLLVASVAVFCILPDIFDRLVLAPCHADFPLYALFNRLEDSAAALMGASAPEHGDFSVSLINTQLASQFFIHISFSVQLALVITFPVLIYQLWTFVAPALYPNERRYASGAFFFGNLLFYMGMLTAYFLIFPLTVRFLSEYQLSAEIPNTITLDSYMDNFVSMLLVMGITFEIPLITWVLGRLGILTRDFFSTYRRHAVVVLVVAAAIITPTSDPFTLMAVFLPLYLLWELSARLTPRKAMEQAVE